MSLLVMSGVLIVGASLGTISILNLRQSRVIDDAVTAFAAAESGAEQTLYQLRRGGALSGYLNANGSHTSGTAASGPPLTGGAGWTRTLTNSETTLFATIPKNRAYEIVLWDPESPASPAGIESMTFSWDDNCGGTSGIEVLSTGWDPNAVGGFNPAIAYHGDSPALTFLKTSPYVIDNDFVATRAYRLRLRARVCDISNLAVSAYSGDNAGGVQIPIPSRVTATVTGTYASARQALEFRLPRLQPLSGAFDYVIFSQCSLIKGAATICP
jgi:hypothetical protein